MCTFFNIFQISGKDIIDSIKSETSGDLQTGFKALSKYSPHFLSCIGMLGLREDIYSSPHSPKTSICDIRTLKERQDKLMDMYLNIEYLIYTMYIPVVLKERIHKHVSYKYARIVPLTSSMWNKCKIDNGLLVNGITMSLRRSLSD